MTTASVPTSRHARPRSASGALAYVPSPVVPYPDAVLVTVDRQGRVRDMPTQRLKYRPAVSLSPDRKSAIDAG